VFVVLQEKDGPILNAVCCLGCNFEQETLSNLGLGQLPSGVDQFGDLRVAPQAKRQAEIIL
jgi:hypothetical protein